MGLFNKLLHAGEGRKLKLVESIVPEVAAFEPEMEARSDEALRAMTDEFRGRLAHCETKEERVEMLDDMLPEAFAAVREAAKRTLGQRHFDVQIMGGAALHFGWVAEMKTGEGKTLVATLPALPERARRLRLPPRDRQRLPRPARRRVDGADLPVPRARGRRRRPRRSTTRSRSGLRTHADITYGTNNEFGFDYLRDNMAVLERGTGPAGPLLRHRRRGRLDPRRRGPHAADHLGPGRRRAGALLPVRPRREGPPARPRLRGRRGEAHGRADRGRHRPRRAGARRRKPLRARQPELRPPAPSRAPRARSCSRGTSTTSSRTARRRSSTSSPAASSRVAAGAKASIRPSRPRKVSRSRRRTRPSRPSRSRTTSACTRSSPA